MAVSEKSSDRDLIELGAKMHLSERKGVVNAYPMTPAKDWETFKTIGHEIIKTGPSTIGAVAGSLAGSVFGPPGMIIGESVGSMTGEAISQDLGITARDPDQVMAAGAVPPLMRGLWGAGRMGLMRLPGAAVELQAQGTELARSMPSMIKAPRTVTIDPKTGRPFTSDDLYARVRAMEEKAQAEQNANPILISTKHQKRAAQELRDKNQLASNPELIDDSVTRLVDGILKRPDLGVTNMAQWDRDRQGYGLASKYTGKDRTVALQQANAKIYGAMYKDIDETIAVASDEAAKSGITPAVLRELKHALDMHRTEKTQEKLLEVINTQFIPKQQGTGLEYVQGKSLRQYLMKDKWIKTLPKEERDDLMAAADMIVSVPSLPAPGTTQIGGGRVLARSAGAAGLTQWGTGDYGLSSAAAGLAAWGPQVISYALATRPGRAMLRGIMSQTQGAVTPQALAILGAFMASTQAQPGTEMTQ